MVRKFTVGELALRAVQVTEAAAIVRRTETRVNYYRELATIDLTQRSESSSEPAKPRRSLERKGKGVIDRFVFSDEDHKRKRREAKAVKAKSPVGPASGLPPPNSVPHLNQYRPRTSRVTTETAIWTEEVNYEGQFEWSRVAEDGLKEWLTATEVNAREWVIKKSKSTKR
jgi:hypothetical protein